MRYAVSNDTMRVSEERTIESGVNADMLVKRAGEGVYALLPKDKSFRYAVICGNGYNGADGYVIAQALIRDGYDVRVYAAGETAIPEIFRSMPYKGRIRDIRFADDTGGVDVAIDCMFGRGFHGELSGVFINAADALNRAKYVVACDISSGLNGDNGRADTHCVKADLTAAVGAIKVGHLLNDGKDYSGEIKVIDIGVEIISEKYYIADESLLERYFVKRKYNSHKGSYGSVGIVGCCERYPGAGKLAAAAALNVMGESALRCGAGLCVLCVPDAMLEAMWGCVSNVTLRSQSELDGMDTDVIAFGTGAGNTEGTLTLLKRILRYNKPLVIDADGLNALAGNVELLLKRDNLTVITPHVKEMSRLSGLSVEDILDGPISAAKSFAARYGCITVLKGNTTVISDGRSVILSDSGSPGQAKGGSGDVLSGVIAAVIAGNNKQRRLEDIEAVAAAVYLCGRAGERAAKTFGEYGMTATDTAMSVALTIEEIIRG